MGGLPLEFITIQPQKRESGYRKGWSASRFHQLEIVNIKPLKRGSAFRIHPHTAPKWGSDSTIHQHQPENGGPHLGTISMDLAVLCLIYLELQILIMLLSNFEEIYSIRHSLDMSYGDV